MRRGITFEALGKNWCLRFDINALCELEAAFDCPVQEIGQRLQGSPRVADIRTAFWAGLGDRDMTMQEAGEIMTEVGIGRAGALIGQAMAEAFAAEAAEGGDKGTPGKRKAAA